MHTAYRKKRKKQYLLSFSQAPNENKTVMTQLASFIKGLLMKNKVQF